MVGKYILGVGLLIVLIGGWGVSKVKVDVNFKNFFKPGTEIRDSMDFIDDQMSGSMNMVVRVESDIKQPEVLLTMEKIQAFVESDSNITTSISIADVIKQMHRVVMNDDPKYEHNKSRFHDLVPKNDPVGRLESVMMKTINRIRN